MSKVLVAGAGHGGLSAAAILAKNGFDVTVIEKCERKDIGHDWHDTMDLPAFTFADIPFPDEKDFKRGLHMCYSNPKKTVKLITDTGPGTSSACISIDRKFLINYLIDHCLKCGVSFVFGCEITKAITEETRVKGISVLKNGKEEDIYADMVIDAAGMNSPVRRSLPEDFNIQNEISVEDTFEIYRVYFENTEKYISEPNYYVYFFNCAKPGIDWVITEEDYIDVLIGKFGELTDEEIEDSLNDLKKTYPLNTDKIIRGGVRAKIPLSKTLPLIVSDGYALVGDSASMTVPLNGSGIDLSLQAGKLLASAVISAEKKGFKKEELWQYQYRYFTLFGNQLVPISIMRKFFGVVTADDIDFFLEKGLLTEKEIGMAGGISGLTPSYVIDKMITALPKIKLLPSLASVMKTLPLYPVASKLMPSQWDDKKIRKWLEIYKEL